MGKNPLLLGSVSFSVSLVISLLTSRDIKTAFTTGLISVPATLTGVGFVNLKQRNQQKLILNDLQAEIHQLERWQVQLNRSLLEIADKKQKTATNINFLQTQLRQLSDRTTEQRQHKQQITQELDTLSEQKSHLEIASQELHHQIYNLEQRKGELDQSVRSLKKLKHDVEAQFNLFESELEQMRCQIEQLQIEKQELEDNITLLNRLRPQLEEKSHTLQTEIQQLEKQQLDLNNSLAAIAEQKITTQIQHNSLQKQILEDRLIYDKIKQEITNLIEQRETLNSDRQFEKVPDEWSSFVAHLNEPELQVLNAIIQENDPTAAIKKIAEDNITMPELLIDSINECALDTIGDLIIEPGTETIPLAIMEEYLTQLNKVMKLNKTT
ncbi:tellurite resistance TerB C-terminal domain-containing protein [Aliterella atlantica]